MADAVHQALKIGDAVWRSNPGHAGGIIEALIVHGEFDFLRDLSRIRSMSGYYSYGHDSRVGQDYDPSPPRLQAYMQHAERLVAAKAVQMPTIPFFVWILDADGREYVHPFTSGDEMRAMLRRKNQNFYYVGIFNKTGPVWPEPEGSGYGCHSPEWNTRSSTFSPKQVPCPSTVSGYGYGLPVFVGAIPDDVRGKVTWYVSAAQRESDALGAWFAIESATRLLQPLTDVFSQPDWALFQTLNDQQFWLQEYLRGKKLPADWQRQARGSYQRSAPELGRGIYGHSH